jgi:DASH complex subunit ASK1
MLTQTQFWKQFFEASANVSLSGVEEREEEEEDETYTESHDQASTYETTETSGADETVHADGEGDGHHYDQTTDSIMDNVEVSGSTPRRPRPKSATKFAGYSSPYEALKKEMKGRSGDEIGDETDNTIQPSTPGPQSRLPDMSMSPHSSPFEAGLPSMQKRTAAGPEHQALLHRVLDKNYRVQATPHKTPKQKGGKTSWRDLDSPMSSPPEAAPQLRAEIFSSPVRLAYNHQHQTGQMPRTPGVSVQTPGKGRGKGVDVPRSAAKKKDKDEITWESDSDEDPEGVYRKLGMSPPKTIQFSMPQSRLMQTPGTYSSCVISFSSRYKTKTIWKGKKANMHIRSARSKQANRPRPPSDGGRGIR